ncbi:MAG: arginine--tRNA ligase [Minisyncoccia bacterium]
MTNNSEKLFNFLQKYYQKEEKNIELLKTKLNEIHGKQDFEVYFLSKIQNEIEFVLKDTIPEIKEDEILLEEPPAYIQGDLCFACFGLAKRLKKSPLLLAEEIVNLINNNEHKKYIEQVRCEGAYINIILKKEIYTEILDQIILLGEKFGESNINKNLRVLIDYSSPNIAKPIGLNHLPSTIIGQVLGNIYEETGAQVIRHNYLGDWGTNFGALLWAYFQWDDDEKIKKEPVQELKNLYVRFFEEASKNEKLIEEARELFNRLEQGDQKLLNLWKKFRDLSVKAFQKVYKRLGINFDIYLGESYFLSEVDNVINEAIEKGIAKQNNQLVVVENLDNLPSFLLRKEDGSTLYLSRDLAALKLRFEKFNLNLLLYVVGSEQSLHFQQLFALAKAMGYLTESKQAEHVPFGLILIEGKKMATRKGSLIEMEDLLNEAVERAEKVIIKKNPKMPSKKARKIAEMIGLAAVIYNSLRSSRLQNIDFDWERVLNFEAASAPYLQYSCVRIKSILKKVEKEGINIKNKGNILFENPIEYQLIKKLMFFPNVILRAQKENSPHFLCGYLEGLAQLFNKFYDEVPVLKTENENLRAARIDLIKSVLLVLEKGLKLLNISVPEEM